MRLTVVGCSGSAPGPASAASCYLVEEDGFRLLLDLGNGSFGTLQGLVDPDTVDAVFLSHLHADHCLDVAPFIVWHRYSGRSSGRPVPLYAPVGADRRLALAYGEDGGPIDDVFTAMAVGPGTFPLGPFTATTVRTQHPVECHAVRLDAGGRSLVYSGDTGACEDLVSLSRGADVLLAEAAHPDGVVQSPGLHLTGRQAGEHAAAAGVGRLLLTHVPPWLDERAQLAAAASAFPATELVHTGAMYDI